MLPRLPRPPRLVTWFALAVAGTLALQAGALAAPAGGRSALFALAWIAGGTLALGAAVLCARRTTAAVRRSWVVWALACAAWLAGAGLRLGVAVTGSDGLETAADLAWLAFPLVAALAIASDAPRGSLSFGLFLLDAVPLVLLLTVVVRLTIPHPLEQAHAHELVHLALPLLYGLVALLGLQVLALQRDRLRSPNLWGFGVAQPLLALAALGWPGALGETPGGALPWEALWTLGFLAAGAAAIARARKPAVVPELSPLDESGLRALPPALGVLGLLLVAALAPPDYRVLAAALAVVSLSCFAARAFLVQREHRRSHRGRLENAEKLRALVGNIPGAVYRARLDDEWTIEFMSEEIESLTGHPAAAFLAGGSVSFATIEHPDDRDRLDRHIRGRVAAGEPYAHEYRIVRADGDVRWVLDRGQAAYGRDGGALWVDGVLLDVTERKRAEERLERQTELLWLLQRVAVAANEARDADEAFSACADEVCASTGWPVGHVLVRTDAGELRSAGLWHGGDAGALGPVRAARESLAFPPGVDLPGRVLASGRAEWLEELAPAADASGAVLDAGLGFRSGFAFPVLVGTEVAGVLEFFSPEARPRDDELLRVMDNIGTVLGRVVERTRAERALAEHNERLLELDALKDEFVSLVSHELRTPLTSIRGYLELVLGDEAAPLGAEHRGFLRVVERNTDRLLRLIGDLLFVAQLDAGRLSVERGDADLAVIAAECVEAAEPLAAQRGVGMTLEAEPAVLAGDRARLAQLVDNLLSNALKFTAEGGLVAVRVTSRAGAVAVEVEDSGIGIPADEQARLFERFFRSSNARRGAIQGTGLGLAIVQAIAEAHGGSVAIASAEGEGTTVRVDLPATAAEVEPVAPNGRVSAVAGSREPEPA